MSKTIKKVGAKKVKKEKKALYQVLLIVNEKNFEAGGDTLLEAFDKLENLEIFSTPGLLKVKKDGKEADMFFVIPRLRSFFFDKTFRQITVDNFEMMLK